MAHIKDTDYLYATARVRSLERSFITRDRLERMVEARSPEDAAKILTECGYGEVEGRDIDSLIGDARIEAFTLCEEIAPDHALVDFFRLKYDYHNAKAVVKGEAAGQDAERLLMDCGRVSKRRLLECYRNLLWKDLPPVMGGAIVDARELLARTVDPQLADLLLDRAYFKELTEIAGGAGSVFLSGLLTLMIDCANLKSAVRAQRLGQSADFMKNVLVPGGSVDEERLTSAVLSGGSPEDMYSGALAEAAAAASPVMKGECGQTEFERLCDNAIVSYLHTARYVSFGDAPLIAYLATRENEFTAVRIIMSGRAMGLPSEMIRERLRHV